MMTRLILAAFVLGGTVSEARQRPPPLYDPVLLNTGIICKWNERCIARQRRAMRSALAYVKKHGIAWKVELCNRNSARNGTRKDWVGFNNCIRNDAIRAPRSYRLKRGS
ncbi:MAG TPA: hypothetical protein VFK50_01960 [Sphingomicrobium sp.]|nr:hypothetical protein [Sphingomicrobium sp.]